MLQKLTIQGYVDSLTENFRTFKETFPTAFRAAEQINDFFWQIYKIDFLRDSEIVWQQTAQEMFFGSLISWANSFVNAASGLDELAQTSARRAIEFVCYISKINNSDDRAELWMRQRQDEESRKQFSRIFSVPRCYFSEGYEHLDKLLLMYDHYSDFGTHANMAMLAQKKKEVGSKFTDVVFEESRYIPMNVNTKIHLGFFLLNSISHTFRELSDDYRALFDKLPELYTAVKLADSEILSFELKSGIEPEIITTLTAQPDLLKSKFQKLKQSYLPK